MYVCWSFCVFFFLFVIFPLVRHVHNKGLLFGAVEQPGGPERGLHLLQQQQRLVQQQQGVGKLARPATNVWHLQQGYTVGRNSHMIVSATFQSRVDPRFPMALPLPL